MVNGQWSITISIRKILFTIHNSLFTTSMLNGQPNTMDLSFRKFSFVFLLCCVTKLHSQEGHNLKLWYDEPAGNWNEALPIGNGRLAAMVFGTTGTERLQLNEETVW